MRLTAKERILVHLADFAKYVEKAEVPPEMGQDGVAQAVDIYVQHVRQFIDPLLKEGLLRERTAHVKGHRRRLKVYDLTDSGRLAASRLRELVRADSVRVRDAQGVRMTTVGDALREAKGTVPLGDILRAAIEGETVDLTMREGEKGEFVERLSEVPRIGPFVGRQAEIDALASTGPGPRFFVVRGVAGIGKSSLAAKACERLRGKRNLFWHRIRPWDTRETILADLGGFLAQTGRPGLKSVLARGEADRADQVLREDLPGTESFLVFDDAQEGSAEVHSFLRFLKDILDLALDVRVLVLTRVAVPAYDRRDVAILGRVREIDLEGLDAEEVDELLSADPDAPRLLPLAERLGGHPLLLELLRSAGRTEVRTAALRDVRRFIDEEIYGRLSDRERKMMKVASLYEIPVPREALFVDEQLSHDVLLSLLDRSLLRPIGGDTFAAHDTIRDFFASVLTPAERKTLASFTVRQLRHLALQAQDAGDPVACIHCLSNALRLVEEGTERANLYESLGDANERIGDLPDAMTAYKSALTGLDEPEDQARVHRKFAMALQNRGGTTNALAEIEQGLRSLDGRRSVEQGWLDLVRCRVAMMVEDFGEAIEHGNRALQTFQSFDERRGIAESLLELGRVEIDRDGGRPDQALQYLQDALGHAPAAGGEALAARVHMEMARNLAWRLLGVEQAMQHLAAAESLLARAQDPHLVRLFLMLRGRLNLDLRADFDAARRDFREAIGLARRVHSQETIAFARFRLARLQFFEGHAEEARQEFEELADEMKMLGYPNFVVDCQWMVAECSMWIGDAQGFLAALSHLRTPELERAIESRPLHGAVLRGLELWLRGDRDGSIAAFRAAVREAEAIYTTDVTTPVYITEIYLAAALGAIGRGAEAEDSIRRASEFLQKHSLVASLSITQQACRRFSDFLRGASSPRPRS